MADDVPPLLVVTGPPGAGKSVVSAAIVAAVGSTVLVEGDDLFAFPRNQRFAPWEAGADAMNRVVLEAAARAAGTFVDHGHTTIYDGVLLPRDVATFVRHAGVDALDLAVLLPDVDRCVANVLDREGHGFTDETATRQMHDEFVRSGVAPRHVLAPGTTIAGMAADLLRRRHAGGFRVVAS